MDKLNLSEEVYKIQDATKIQKYMTCERLYFLEFIMNIRPEGENHNLIFGQAFHKGKDILFIKGYSLESCKLAYQAFIEHYRKVYSPDTDMDFRGKTPLGAETAFLTYVNQYKDDDFTVLYTEIGIAVPIGKGRTLYGNMDSIMKGSRGIFSLETKTSGATWSYLQDQFMMKFQIDVYTHFLYSFFDPKEVYGVIVDVTVLKKEPEHIRVHCVKSIDHLEEWLYDANYWFDCIEKDFDHLSHESESDKSMHSFIRRTESCIQYNRMCPYFDLCHAWHNPLQKIGTIPMGYKIEKWDPRHTGNKVELKTEGGINSEVRIDNSEENPGLL